MKSRVSGVGASSHGKTVCNGTKVQLKEEVYTVELVVVRKYDKCVGRRSHLAANDSL